ncbi:MAG: processed acidic surface protein [Bhargavaea sp.]
MKRLLSVLLAFVIGIGALPAMTYAIESNEPGFEEFLRSIGWDKQDYIDYLEMKGWYLEDFESVDELGTPITEETVQTVLAEFGLNREELNDLLVEFGELEEGQDVLEGTYIIFSEELHESVDFYLNEWEETPVDEYLDEEIYGLFTEIGLTNEELDRLFAHLETLDFEDPAFLNQLIELSDRMMAFEEFDTADELSAGQIAELIDIFSDMLNLFQVDAKYYLVKDGEKQTVSFETLMNMDTTDSYDLLIEIYNKQGVFLADVLLTADMFGSQLIKETGNDIKQAEGIVSGVTKSVQPKQSVKTIKGGKLPKTASDYAGNAIAGLAIVLVGVFLLRRFKVKGI